MLEIDVQYDSSVENLERSNPSLYSEFTSGVTAAVQDLEQLISSPVTVTIDVGYGEVDGQSLDSDDLGESETNWASESYSSVRNALIAENAPGSSTLPTTSPASGTLELGTAEAKALGLAPNDGDPDGFVGFSSSLPFSYANGVTPGNGEYYFIGVVEHEITEAMGRVSLVGQQSRSYSLMDLYRYSAPGTRDLTTGNSRSNSTAYFSVDGGTTNLGTWNNVPSNGDLGDWYPAGPAPNGDDAFNDYSDPGAIDQLLQGDATLLAALGFSETSDVPFLLSDNPLSLSAGTTATIGLNQLSFGIAGLPSEEIYTVTSGPQEGALLLNGAPTNSFTQAEINSGQVSYRETGVATSDSFGFTVSDEFGYTTATQQFQINIAADVPFLVADSPLSLYAGTTATIGPGQLRFGIAGLSSQETYTVTSAPQHGALLLNGSPTRSFTQAEINSGQVSYRETGSATSDTIGFTVSDPVGYTTAAEQLQINIISDVPFLLADNPLQLSAGTTAAIGPGQLSFGIAGLPSQETYSVTSAPQEGRLLLNGSPTSSFTQAEIDNGQVSYQETGAAGSDTIGFTVSDPQGFTTAPEQLQVNIATDVPFLVNDNPLSLAAGMTAVIGPNQLSFGIAGMPSQETYTVTSAAQDGVLLLSGSAASRFTQAEIDNGQVSYRETGAAASDSFGFTVSDQVGYTTSGQLFQIHIS